MYNVNSFIEKYGIKFIIFIRRYKIIFFYLLELLLWIIIIIIVLLSY